VAEGNAVLLEAHRRAVEGRLHLEMVQQVEDRLAGVEGGGCCGECSGGGEGGGGRAGSRRRFLPHLEEIPEESRCSTIPREGEAGLEEPGEEGGHQTGTGRSRRQALSLDSGIVTRSASPTPEQRSDTSELSSSQGVYSDDETVDVAGSEEEETDSEGGQQEAEPAGQRVVMEGPPAAGRRCSTEPGRGRVKSNLDFLSQIYNTAFSKLPTVESGEELRTAVYRNPALEPDLEPDFSRTLDPLARTGGQGVGVTRVSGVSGGTGVSGVSLCPEERKEIQPGEVRRSFKFSSGEKMTIAICPDLGDPVFSGQDWWISSE
jgi:hypothetical protein